MFQSLRGQFPAMASALLTVLLTAVFTTADAARARSPSWQELSRYDKVMIEPVKVHFIRDGIPFTTGTRLGIQTTARREGLALAKLFDATFREELQRDGITVVDQPGEGVLRITPALINVRLAAPITDDARPREILHRSVGELTFVANFHDSKTGKALAAMEDRVQGRENGLLRTATPQHARAEVKDIIEEWGVLVREGLLAAE